MTMKQLKAQSSKTGDRNRDAGKYLGNWFNLSGLTKSYERKNKRDVWTITNKPYKGAHFAVFPPDLIEPCIRRGKGGRCNSRSIYNRELQQWLLRNIVVIY